MRAPTFTSIAILLTVAGSATAADFRLIIKADEARFSQTKSIIIHGLKFRPDDRVVAVSFSQTAGTSMFRVSGGPEQPNGAILAGPNRAKGFSGRIASSPTQAPQGSFYASLETVPVAGAVPPRRTGVTKAVEGFFNSTSISIIALIVGGLVVAGFLLRPRSREEVYVPPKKRRTVDEALNEIVARLEEIDAKQKELVKKPPVLRSFSRQIAGFEDRLNALDGSLRNLQANVAKNSDSSSGVERGLREVSTRLQGVADTLAASTAGAKQSIEALRAQVDAAERAARESASRSAEALIAQGKHNDELQSMLFVVQENGKSSATGIASLTADVERLKADLEVRDAGADATRERLDAEIGKLVERWDHVMEAFTAQQGLETEVKALRSEYVAAQETTAKSIAQLSGAVQHSETLSREQAEKAAHAMKESMAELGARVEALSEKLRDEDALALSAEVHALKTAVAGLTDGLAVLQQELNGVRSDLPRLDASAALDALRNDVTAIDIPVADLQPVLEKLDELAGRIDEREAILQELQSQIGPRAEGMDSGSELLPVLADLRLELRAIAAEQEKSSEQTAQLALRVDQVGAREPSVTEDVIAEQFGSLAAKQEELVRQIGSLSSYLKAGRAEAAERIQVLELTLGNIQGAAAATVAEEHAAPELVLETTIPQSEPAEPEPVDEPLVVAEEDMPLPEAPVHPLEEPQAEEEMPSVPADAQVWASMGSNPARQWAIHSQVRVGSVSGEEALAALTPTETPAIDYELGEMVFAAGRVVYAHGDTLRGFWPGKGVNGVRLKAEISRGRNSLLAMQHLVFCITESHVEVVNTSTWTGHARFAGEYVDQLDTGSAWVGIAKTETGYALDFRDLGGKAISPTLALPTSLRQLAGSASDAENVYLLDVSGTVVRVSPAGITEIPLAIGEKEAFSLTLHGKTLVVLARGPKGDTVISVTRDGKSRKELGLAFKSAAGHPVVMNDRLFVVDAREEEAQILNLRKLEIEKTVRLPAGRVAEFCGIRSANESWLLLSLLEGDGPRGRVVLHNPASGEFQMVCKFNHPHLAVMPGKDTIVVATGCSYQNMIQVFELPTAASQAKAA